MTIPSFAELRVQNLVYQRKTWFNKENPGITIAKPGFTEEVELLYYRLNLINQILQSVSLVQIAASRIHTNSDLLIHVV